MREIKKLIIHCSDSDDSLDIGVEKINEWHRQRGWLSPSGVSCGYHYIIKRDGTVEIGRPDYEVGAHCRGENKNSLGIVLIGRKDFSDDQIESLFAMCWGLSHKHQLDPTEDIYGHYEFDSGKTCPNLDMIKFRAEMLFNA
jgi:N-acetylmuramoyl-L-alanine amidase